MHRHIVRLGLPTVTVLGLGLCSSLSPSGCSCPQPENLEAKERLSKPPPPDPVEVRAQEVLDVRQLDKDAATLKRISRMRFTEVRKRLAAVRFTSDASFSFVRDDVKVTSKEKVEIVQTEEGDFSVDLVTGDGSTQNLVYANDVFFLKNNNGQWRASRDPVGERVEYLEDSAGAWRMIYDLFAHTMVLEPAKPVTWAGRAALRYNFEVGDQSNEAYKLARGRPYVDGKGILEADAGPLSDEMMQKRKAEVMGRVREWKDRARPSGGSGHLIVDRETGVIVTVVFKGQLMVGDAKNPAELDASVTAKMSDPGGEKLAVAVPKEAVAEVSRKKWPIRPRQVLEKAGLVPELTAEEKAALKAGATKKPTPKKKPTEAQAKAEGE